MKRHSLTIEGNGSGLDERRVDRSARLILRTGRVMRSFKVGELTSFKIHPGFADEHVVLELVDSNGRGSVESLPRGARVEIANETWSAGDLVSFTLQKDAEPPEVIRPYPEGTWLVHRRDNSTTRLENVASFEDLSTWISVDGIARPPEMAS
jgi:hypothetical protein